MNIRQRNRNRNVVSCISFRLYDVILRFILLLQLAVDKIVSSWMRCRSRCSDCGEIVVDIVVVFLLLFFFILMTRTLTNYIDITLCEFSFLFIAFYLAANNKQKSCFVYSICMCVNVSLCVWMKSRETRQRRVQWKVATTQVFLLLYIQVATAFVAFSAAKNRRHYFTHCIQNARALFLLVVFL